ncbi:MAG: hypothetical protein Q4F85_02005 [Prevotella sp.]|nr:hypothetical protein [Prevotella sp.]
MRKRAEAPHRYAEGGGDGNDIKRGKRYGDGAERRVPQAAHGAEQHGVGHQREHGGGNEKQHRDRGDANKRRAATDTAVTQAADDARGAQHARRHGKQQQPHKQR